MVAILYSIYLTSSVLSISALCRFSFIFIIVNMEGKPFIPFKWPNIDLSILRLSTSADHRFRIEDVYRICQPMRKDSTGRSPSLAKLISLSRSLFPSSVHYIQLSWKWRQIHQRIRTDQSSATSEITRSTHNAEEEEDPLSRLLSVHPPMNRVWLSWNDTIVSCNSCATDSRCSPTLNVLFDSLGQHLFLSLPLSLVKSNISIACFLGKTLFRKMTIHSMTSALKKPPFSTISVPCILDWVPTKIEKHKKFVHHTYGHLQSLRLSLFP